MCDLTEQREQILSINLQTGHTCLKREKSAIKYVELHDIECMDLVSKSGITFVKSESVMSSCPLQTRLL